MGQVADSLKNPFKTPGLHLVKDQGHNYGQRDCSEKAVKTDSQGVSDSGSKLKWVEEPDIVLEQRFREGAAQDAQGVPVVLKRDNYPVHRQIGKTERQQHCRK